MSVPTTYSGAEWTTSFGIRNPGRLMRGHGSGAHPAGIVYEPKLTLDLPRGASGGTAMNALAHCAEALYVEGHNPEADRDALEGARLIGESLPSVLEDGHDLETRTTLLRGAMHAGVAFGSAGLGLAHAMAQAIGGRYGIAHGAANALCLPPALRFNEPVAGDEIARFAEALGTDDAPSALRGARAPLGLRAPARPRRPGGRAGRGRRGGGRAPRGARQPTQGEPGRSRRAPAPTSGSR